MAPVICGDVHMEMAEYDKAIIEITEKCSILTSEPSSPVDMDTRGKTTQIVQPRTSRPTSSNNSMHHHSRSNSRSTAPSRPTSPHSSFRSSRKPANIVPVSLPRPSPHERRESLLALHRESCRLFNEPESSTWPTDDLSLTRSAHRTASTYKSRRDGRTSSETGASTPPSPISPLPFHRHSLSATHASNMHQIRDRSNTDPGSQGHVHSPSTSSSIHVPATVMEWTSPSTRRQEYEKIDRASRGVRGLWRRVAPRWCHRDSRIPFFEEGKTSTSREGSVRRFRMDLPDSVPEDRSQHFRPSRLSHHDSCSRRLWKGRRSKTCL
ncbi:hypothetical protein N7495_008775 [Penicillium taxi]|uniref:uncharacterized protein n=1 Tax=Penicillium taxi TaxID=168475 RepID=UPI0025455381|nr:uncharacterized protein N7495_008775 [Penicillium taxi]KAJ5888734.1 hypothetical protein N7495_008775 [Penicillium taxi]